MKDWTDREYAQAAIDMLPGTVEEIDMHMKVHGIVNRKSVFRSTSCPVALWMRRWVENEFTAVDFDYVSTWDFSIELPEHIRAYIIYADKQIKPL